MQQLFKWLVLVVFGLGGPAWAGSTKTPVYVALNLEFGHATSTSDDAIRLGTQIAVDEINRAGGVLGGRPLAIIERDDRSVPARAVANVRELAAMPDVVAVFCGKFSPVALELLPVVHEVKIPLLDPWAAADGIIDNGYSPNYAFRLSLRDSWAISVMLEQAMQSGKKRIGLLLPNTAWGRSSLKAAEAYLGENPQVRAVSTQWYNWGDHSLLDQYRKIRNAGAELLILVANEKEGSLLVNDLAAMPEQERLPILSHWGVTGGAFFEMTRGAPARLDFSVVQTFSFLDADSRKAAMVVAEARSRIGIERAEQIPSPVGVAHAYDLTHLLARAVARAGSTDRAAVRDALEQLRDYQGLVRNYTRPFAPDRHEALTRSSVFMARYGEDGALRRISRR